MLLYNTLWKFYSWLILFIYQLAIFFENNKFSLAGEKTIADCVNEFRHKINLYYCKKCVHFIIYLPLSCLRFHGNLYRFNRKKVYPLRSDLDRKLFGLHWRRINEKPDLWKLCVSNLETAIRLVNSVSLWFLFFHQFADHIGVKYIALQPHRSIFCALYWNVRNYHLFFFNQHRFQHYQGNARIRFDAL